MDLFDMSMFVEGEEFVAQDNQDPQTSEAETVGNLHQMQAIGQVGFPETALNCETISPVVPLASDSLISSFEMRPELTFDQFWSHAHVGTWALPVEVAGGDHLCASMPPSGFDGFYNTFSGSVYAPSSGRRAHKPQPPSTTLSTTFSCAPGMHGNGPSLGSKTPARQVELGIVLEDPKNGVSPREKRVRSREELESQKKAMRTLKEKGGACEACFKSKKRCGPGNPCPSCARRGRQCIRPAQVNRPTKSAEGQAPVSAPPVQAPSVQAPPVQAPSVQAPPTQAPPVQASSGFLEPMLEASSQQTSLGSSPNFLCVPTFSSSPGWGNSDSTQSPLLFDTSDFPLDIGLSMNIDFPMNTDFDKNMAIDPKLIEDPALLYTGPLEEPSDPVLFDPWAPHMFSDDGDPNDATQTWPGLFDLN
ncbi:Fungal Zn(2)-Cys(6) binuclear cluster domain-containing protein [Penicillium ucsense]|uniref:Fungal Zn(2)-Cys(6) binuclear cluster domain-containing protein n=1 Tax=Penicillium ucsense TaxID=2839758 RepID=A0A8J8WIX7_9EURO|nr:Fungal Zn(2)-Cys(6) binuclear cluster domain-containing protein [Penicillium ucsense]KAF7736876.1 Fungal Zn(2)-Cys(6) binuclear cluster domain-containing protein [Penicillium ucsense]